MNFKKFGDVRELLYPMEWFFRFIIIALFLQILKLYYPQSYLVFPVGYYFFILGAVIAFIVQIVYLWDWLTDSDKLEC